MRPTRVAPRRRGADQSAVNDLALGRWFSGAWPGRWRVLDVGIRSPDYTPPDAVLRDRVAKELAVAQLPDRVDRASVGPLLLCEECHRLIIGTPGAQGRGDRWFGDRAQQVIRVGGEPTSISVLRCGGRWKATLQLGDRWLELNGFCIPWETIELEYATPEEISELKRRHG